MWTSHTMPDELAVGTEAELSAKAAAVADRAGTNAIRAILEDARNRVHNRQRDRWLAVIDSVLASLDDTRHTTA